ncbi:MAG: cellulase family glycosylhydrolase, partial [Planctomycetes bacterium]|nr:cellulase family glycosylhydrolase [Planctomycetota bacterium]
SQSGLVNPAQFDAWIQNFVVPYAEHLSSRGLYLVLSATGPINTPNNGTRNAGVVEQQRLITFWQTVANAPGVKNADNIMFELMNEPVEIESSPGNGDWGNHQSKYHLAFRNWIQPIIDAIRGTGADNVIWVPTLDWQGSPHQWVEYPFFGTNIGVACHFYPAYGGVFDDPARVQSLWDRQYKPAADRWPMIITEMFWTPYPDDPWNLVNGTTAGFGNAIKNAMDNQGNVSYLVGFLGDLLHHLNDALPANCTLSPREGAQAYFDWLPTYTWAAPSDRPRGLSATRVTNAQINLAWTGVPDALSYNIKRSTGSGGPYAVLASDITATSFGDTNITPDEIYYYVVSANMPSGESPDSNEATPVGLRAYLKFDEAEGAVAYDATDNGWNGALNGDAVWTEGRFANAIYLNGTDGYVSLPTGVVDGLTDVTISAWVNLDTISDWSRIFDFGNDTKESMYLTPRNGSGVLSFAVSTNAVAAIVDDHFDDGNVGTNIAGVGSGFNA